jgi:3-oxoacyl-[acyl-carrier-protein] synthase II
MLGEGIASGGVRMAADLLILERGVIPPTINYEYPDPCCGLRIVTEGLHASVKTILHMGISLDGTYMVILVGRGDGVS